MTLLSFGLGSSWTGIVAQSISVCCQGSAGSYQPGKKLSKSLCRPFDHFCTVKSLPTQHSCKVLRIGIVKENSQAVLLIVHPLPNLDTQESR